MLAHCNFKDADALFTLTTDGWEAPDGHSIRNYMAVLPEAFERIQKLIFIHWNLRALQLLAAGAGRPTRVPAGYLDEQLSP